MIEFPRDVIRREAIAQGFDPNVAIAVATVEAPSYLDTGDTSKAVGDAGTSFGPFQEHVGGGAGDAVIAAGGTVADLFDSQSATDRFIDRYRRAQATLGTATPGDIAAAAQRPADPEGYAAKVNALLGLGSPAAAAGSDIASRSSGDIARSSTTATAVAGDACTGVDAGKVARVRAWLDRNAAYGAQDPALTAARLRSAFPDIPVACLQQIAYGKAGDYSGGPGDPLASAVTNLQHGATQLVTALAILGLAGLLIYAGARKSLG